MSVPEQIVDGDGLTNEGLGGFVRRAFIRAQGLGPETTRRRPVIGICNTWSELNPCNGSLRDLAEGVKRGVAQSGGQAFEFPTISLAEQFIFPTSMILRNLMSMDVEEMIRRSPVDAVVLLAGCDKTVPAQLMGAISAGRPMLMLTAGPRSTTRFRNEPLVTDDFWSLASKRVRGEIDNDEWASLEGSLCASVGVCNVLGTATTMAMVAETLGVALPGSSLLGATDARRGALAESVGRRIVELAREEVPPTDIVTRGAIENALRMVLATGGSTNAIIHLEAIAGRIGTRIGLKRLEELSAETPVVTSVRPIGPFLLEDLQAAGGVPSVLKQLQPLLDTSVTTAGGNSLADFLSRIPSATGDCLSSLAEPFQPSGGIGVVWGNLAPRGAIIKRAAANQGLLSHDGPALVFDSAGQAAARSMDSSLTCSENAVLVVRNAGPIGGPGMPELGQIPIPASLRVKGVTDMVCLTDARVSGTQKGTTILHAAPETALGGLMSLVSNDDIISLDSSKGRIELLVADDELDRRRNLLPEQGPIGPARGYERLYLDHVLQADEGCDFDFLRSTDLEGIQ